MEEVKRLSPLKDTLRQLYVLSGNQCAYPGCLRPMFNSDGNFVGQICHIEAAMPGGERFNPNMSNEERREFENLMLMCYEHHIETDKEDEYSVDDMIDMKYEHERIYSDVDGFVDQMQSSVVDVTSRVTGTKVNSLESLYKELYGKDDRDSEDIDADVSAFNSVITEFARLSPEAKSVFAISLSRAKYERGFSGRSTENIYISPYEMERVTRIEPSELRTIFYELEESDFMCFDDLDNVGHVFLICFPKYDINFWEMIKRFCKQKGLDVESIVQHMKYSILD